VTSSHALTDAVKKHFERGLTAAVAEPKARATSHVGPEWFRFLDTRVELYVRALIRDTVATGDVDKDASLSDVKEAAAFFQLFPVRPADGSARVQDSTRRRTHGADLPVHGAGGP
jgi:hypothetical protein